MPFDTKQYAAKVPELGTVPCALVDFETARAAKFAVHVLRQRADEVGFRLAILKPGVEEKLYADDDLKQQNQLSMKNMSDSDNQIDSGVTGSETSDESRSISDGDVDSDLNNSRASISSEDETNKNEKILKKTMDMKRHSITSDTDHSVDYQIKSRKEKKEKNRVVSSVTIFLKSPKESTTKQKFFTREELLKLQHPCPNLNNPFSHVFDEIERNTGTKKSKASRKLDNFTKSKRIKTQFQPQLWKKWTKTSSRDRNRNGQIESIQLVSVDSTNQNRLVAKKSNHFLGKSRFFKQNNKSTGFLVRA